MTEPKNIADELVESMNQAAAIMAGKAEPGRVWVAPVTVNVKAIRKKTGLTQPAFAGEFGFSVGALRDWEQLRKTPDPTARALLAVIDFAPNVVQAALHRENFAPKQ